MEILTEIGQCLRRRRRKFSVGSPWVIEGVRALSHICFQKVCIFYGALGLGVYGCICAHSAPQDLADVESVRFFCVFRQKPPIIEPTLSLVCGVLYPQACATCAHIQGCSSKFTIEHKAELCNHTFTPVHQQPPPAKKKKRNGLGNCCIKLNSLRRMEILQERRLPTLSCAHAIVATCNPVIQKLRLWVDVHLFH